MTNTPIRVVLTYGRHDRRYQTYNAFLSDPANPARPSGEALVINSRDPEHAAARALHERGFSGPVEFYRVGVAYPAIRFRDIAEAAKLAVSEGDQFGPRLTRFKPFELKRGATLSKMAGDGEIGEDTYKPAKGQKEPSRSPVEAMA